MSIEVWNVLGTWFSGIATLAAVVYAFWLQKKYFDSNLPRLVLRPDSERYVPPAWMRDDPADANREELWLRAEVSNEGPATATEVELRLVELFEGERDQQRAKYWFKVATLNTISIKSLHSQFSQMFDLIYLVRTYDQSHSVRAFLAMAPNPMAPWREAKRKVETSRYCELEADRQYRLRVALTSLNARTSYYCFDFCFTSPRSGAWTAESPVGKDELARRVKMSGFTEEAQ